MTLPLYEKDEGFKFDPRNGRTHIALDYQKVGLDLENEGQVTSLIHNVEKEYQRSTGKEGTVSEVSQCESPYGDMVLIMYIDDVEQED